jgi:CcmD family protein
MSDSEVRNFTYLAYGLIACWVILVAYVLTLTARGRRLSRQLENVQRMVEDRESK